MKHSIVITFFVVAHLLALGVLADGVGKVGEKWIYRHEGIRPLSNPPATIRGDRTNEVIAIKGEGANTRWLVKNIWGDNDENPGTLHIDGEQLLHQVDVGSSFSLSFAPGVPVDCPRLKTGEEKTYEAKMKVIGMELPLKYEAKRLADETVKVPAGEFTACRHIQIVIHGTDMQGGPSKSRIDYWFHPKANGLVKEVTITNYGTDAAETSTSSLKAHTAP